MLAQCYNARRFGIDLAEYPRILKCETAMLERAEFRDAHPHFQPDCLEELQGKLSL